MTATKTNKQLLPAHVNTARDKIIDNVQTLIRQKIKPIHMLPLIGILAILLGYMTIAPPTDLPNWPLYSLNAKTWQFFEKWGQHVKPYHLRIMTSAMQHVESRALYLLANYDIPDIIHDAGKPLSCEKIKTIVDERFGFTPMDLSYLCRILHAAAHFDLLAESGHEEYSLTPLSLYLTSKHPKSLKGFVKLFSGDESLIISTALSRSIHSGNSGFKEVYRKELLEHLKTDNLLRTIYDAGTADSSRLHAPAIIADYPPFGYCQHICDIGGGLGSFLYAVMNYYDFKIKGTNFDLPDVIANSKAYFKKMGIHDNQISLVAGNFTDNLPNFECDCYILKDILQDWSDEYAMIILKHLRGVTKKNDKIIIIENVLHTGSYSEERMKSLLDLTMMSFNPSHARLRSADEIYFLLDETNFTNHQIYYTRAGYNVIHSHPK
jgi:hypothetical protein